MSHANRKKALLNRVNPDTGKTYKETYGNNITFDKLSTSDALAVLDEKQKRDIDLINAESKAKWHSLQQRATQRLGYSQELRLSGQ